MTHIVTKMANIAKEGFIIVNKGIYDHMMYFTIIGSFQSYDTVSFLV